MKTRLPTAEDMAALLALALLPEHFSSAMDEESEESQKLVEELVPARAQSRIGALGVILFFVMVMRCRVDTEPTDNAAVAPSQADSDNDDAFAVTGTVIGGIISAAKAREYWVAVKTLFRNLGRQFQPNKPDQLLDNLRKNLTDYAEEAKVKLEAAA